MAELVAIVPTSNDEDSIARVLSELHSVLVLSGISAEVIVVDAGSSDGTVKEVVRVGAAYPLLHIALLEPASKMTGFGSMLRLAMAYSDAPRAVVLSGDGTDPVELVPEMVNLLRSGAQLVVASRYLDGRTHGVARRFVVYQRLYRVAVKVATGSWVSDSTNGFRGFDRRFVLALGLRSRRFSVCPEMTLKVLLAGGSLGFVPGEPRVPGSGLNRFKLAREAPGYVRVIIRSALHYRVRLNWF